MQTCKTVEAQEMVAVDEGWWLPGDSSPSLIRVVPADGGSYPSRATEADLDGGWNLAEGTGEHSPPSFPPQPVLPIKFCPAPLQGAGTLCPEQQAEFSKPDLALGTDIDLPPPSAWFAELTGLVPRTPPETVTQAPASAPQELHLRSCFTESEDAFFANGEELNLAHQEQVQEAQAQAQAQVPTVKRRWWQRRKRTS